MSNHCYGYDSYSELLDAARKEREEKAQRLEIAKLKYRIRELEAENADLRRELKAVMERH